MPFVVWQSIILHKWLFETLEGLFALTKKLNMLGRSQDFPILEQPTRF